MKQNDDIQEFRTKCLLQMSPEYPFNGLSAFGVYTDDQAPADKGNALKSFIKLYIKVNDIDDITCDNIIDMLTKNQYLEDMSDIKNEETKYLLEILNNRLSVISIDSCLSDDIIDCYTAMFYGKIRYSRIKKALKDLTLYDCFKDDATNIWSLFRSIVTWIDQDTTLLSIYRADGTLARIYDELLETDLKHGTDHATMMVGFMLIRARRITGYLPPQLWRLDDFENTGIIGLNKFFSDFGDLYFYKLIKRVVDFGDNNDYKKESLYFRSPIGIRAYETCALSEMDIYNFILKYGNINWYDDDLTKGFSKIIVENQLQNCNYCGEAEIDFSDDYKDVYITIPNKEVADVFTEENIPAFMGTMFGLEALEAYNTTIENNTVIDDTETDQQLTVKPMENVSEIVPDATVLNLLKSLGIFTIKDFAAIDEESVRQASMLYGSSSPQPIISDTAIELIRYKMRDANVKFLSSEESKDILNNAPADLVLLTRLVTKSLISMPLYLSLADKGYTTVKSIDGCMIDSIVLTYSTVNELRTLAEKYGIAVYTHEEFKETLLKTKGVGIPLRHLCNYFNLSKTQIIEIDKTIDVNKYTVQSLWSITFSDWVKMDKTTLMAQFLTQFQKLFPELDYHLALCPTHDDSKTETDYPKEIDDPNGFFGSLAVDRDEDGKVSREEMEYFVMKHMGLSELDNNLKDDPSESIRVMADILMNIPEINSGISGYNDNEKYQEFEDIKHLLIKDNQFKMLPNLKNLLLSENSKFSYPLVLLLIRYVIACKSKNTLDPF